ncbi:MAG: hypothetical protein WC027_02280 [Candidatus Paceibacterota bacterium]
MKNPEEQNNQEILPQKTEEEIRAEQAQKVVKFLDKIRAYEYVKKLLNNKVDTETLNFNDFEDFLIRLNGITRDIPMDERTVDGEKVYLSGFIEDIQVPRHEDKEGILQYAYEQAPNINKEDLKYFLPAVINAVHLFSDGNGRTSRIVHLLLRDYHTKEEFESELQKALGKFGRSRSFDINPGLINYELHEEVLKKHGWVYSEENPQGVLGPIKFGIASAENRELEKENPAYESAQKLLSLYSNNSQYILTAIFMEFGDEVKSLMSEFGEERIPRISPKKMFQILSIKQWESILDNFYRLKKEQAETLIDIFVEPEKYRVNDNNKGELLRDLFIRKIETKKE